VNLLEILGYITAGTTLISIILALFTTRTWTYKIGYALGRMLSAVFVGKMGAAELAVEDRLQTTIVDFTEGLNDGLDADDKKFRRTVKKLTIKE